MKKELIAGLVFLAAGISFAGDAAAFKDIGFSSDGKVYIFGQYGKTDKKYKGYAEIYTVDVEKNVYVPGGVYKRTETSDNSGKQSFEALYSVRASEINRYNCKETAVDDVLYVLEDTKKSGTDEIVFNNIGDSNQIEYKVRLVPTFVGYGENCSSSFYIDLNIDGKKYKVGTPDMKRKGVTGYKIVRILRDAQKTSLIFVVEKTVEDSTGTSIRYMVETVKL